MKQTSNTLKEARLRLNAPLTKRFQMRISAVESNKLKKISQEQGISANQLMREALAGYIESL